MTDIDFIVQHMISQANELDSRGRFAEANRVDRYAQRIVTSAFGGGVAEYVGKLLELARSKGIDYMQSRMKESRIVTLNDGTPIVKQNDSEGFINAVVARARDLKLPETKGLTPNAPGKMDAAWSQQSAQRMEEIESGKSGWLKQSKPLSDAISDKRRKNIKWKPGQSPAKKQVKPFEPVADAGIFEPVADAGIRNTPVSSTESKPNVTKPSTKPAINLPNKPISDIVKSNPSPQKNKSSYITGK